MNTKDETGVECGICHEEAFQLVERKASVKVRCCPRCARRNDAEQQEQTEAEMLKTLDKVERKRLLKEKSHEWAHSWHGKHVIVRYYAGDDGRPIECHIKGSAWYGSKTEDFGLARVRVVLDDAELHRIIFRKERRGWDNIVITEAIVDGIEWGLGRMLITHGYSQELENPLALYINWGERKEKVLEEVDEEAERLAAKRQEEHLRMEQEREIARHIGEGI